MGQAIRVSGLVGLVAIGAAAAGSSGACLESSAAGPDAALSEAGQTDVASAVMDHAGVGSEGAAGDASPSDGGAVEAEAAGLGLLVDDMTATMGTSISLLPPDGGTAGSYSTYSDFPASNYLGMKSVIAGTAQLSDSPISPPITNPDGSQLVGKLCVGRDGMSPGTVLDYAGLNLNFAYGPPAAGAQDSSSASFALPFDASHFGGMSFYLLVSPLDGAASPSMRFGVPDTQTADPAAWPTTACRAAQGQAGDASDANDSAVDAAPATNPCDDDFGADLAITPGVWTKMTFRWADLAQQGWGAPFGALKPEQLIGLKWQVNGSGADATVESFYFCISDIYFTPL